MKQVAKEQTIPIDDLRRNFGEIKKELPFTTFILTDRGKPIAQLSATQNMKKELLMKTAGSLKGTTLDNDQFWQEVRKKHSRKKSVRL